MKHYRIYQLDLAGKIKGPASVIVCPDDGEALEAARVMQKDGMQAVEIWQGGRLVG